MKKVPTVTIDGINLAIELHTSTDYLLTGQNLSTINAKSQLLSAIDLLSTVSKML